MYLNKVVKGSIFATVTSRSLLHSSNVFILKLRVFSGIGISLLLEIFPYYTPKMGLNFTT